MKVDGSRLLSPSLLWGAVLWVLVAGAGFYNLANYPTIWWDEAIFSETAANLAQQGRYAFTVQSPNQLADLDFRISVGPMVILPVALAYRLLGVGLASGRLVAGAYLVLAFLGLYMAARRLWGHGIALGAGALALLGTDVLYWGRSVLGDVPALGLFLWGLWFLMRSRDGQGLQSLFLGGLFLGMAFNAKEFYGMAFIPPLVFLLRGSRGERGRLRRITAYLCGVALPPLAYLAMKAFILGSLIEAVGHFLLQKKLLCHEFFTPLTIGRIYPESFAFLLGHPLFWLALLGVWKICRSSTPTWGEKLWMGNFLLWSLIYLTAVYWYRFALPALFLAAPLAAYLLRCGWRRLTRTLEPKPAGWLTAGMALAFAVLFYPLPGVDLMGAIATAKEDPPCRLVNYLRQNVPSGKLIETPEYELPFLDDDHRFHVMPSYFFVESTSQGVVLLNPRQKPYDFNGIGADVLVLGSFGKSVFQQVYSPALVTRGWRRVARVDYYDIYVRRPQPTEVSHKSRIPSKPRIKVASP